MVSYIKQICFDILAETDFTDMALGEVISESPIKIKISDKIIISDKQFILANKLSDFTMEVNQNPKFPDEPLNEEDFLNRKKIIVYNHLKKGDNVILIKAQGGQIYFVMDKVWGVV